MRLIRERKNIVFINSLNIKDHLDEIVDVGGVIYKIHNLGGIIFVKLLDYSGIIQCVVEVNNFTNINEILKKGNWIEVRGKVVAEKKSRTGFEIWVEKIELLSKGNKKQLPTHSEYNSVLRSISLRHLRNRSIFKVKSVLQSAFCNFLIDNGFTKINTPKIIFNGLGGGSNLFSVDYLKTTAYLSQSPQLYKQTLIGSLQRVFEIGPVFRANRNKSYRQLTEYTSLDIELGPIRDLSELLVLCVSLIRQSLNVIEEKCKCEMSLLKHQISYVKGMPSITYHEALEIINKNSINSKDKFTLAEYAHINWKSDFLFITNNPIKDSAFYFMEDPEMPGTVKNWLLLFKGIGIGGGGQRIHKHKEQKQKMKNLGMDINDFNEYLTAHCYGLPPHGGFTISIERFIMQLLNLKNIKDACLFPRAADL